jgi:uncharacterized protein (DUF1778 family)
MKKNTATFPLRLPESLKAAVEKAAKDDGTSMNQFMATAVAEKLTAMRTATFFAEHKHSADLDLARRILKRSGGQPPAAEDEMPT